MAYRPLASYPNDRPNCASSKLPSRFCHASMLLIYLCPRSGGRDQLASAVLWPPEDGPFLDDRVSIPVAHSQLPAL